jgi:hypothetical protein
MTWELEWLPEADESMHALEDDPTRAGEVEHVHRRLGRLELDPFDPHLGTKQFSTEELGQVRATPCPPTDWLIFWHPHDAADHVLVIAQVIETSSI